MSLARSPSLVGHCQVALRSAFLSVLWKTKDAALQQQLSQLDCRRPEHIAEPAPRTPRLGDSPARPHGRHRAPPRPPARGPPRTPGLPEGERQRCHRSTPGRCHRGHAAPGHGRLAMAKHYRHSLGITSCCQRYCLQLSPYCGSFSGATGKEFILENRLIT